MNRRRSNYTVTINPLGCLIWVAILWLIIKACGG